MRRHHSSKGQGLAEFALILPILLLLLLGIIEGARIIWAYVQVQNATREAARYAVTGQPYDAGGNPWTATDTERVAAIKQVAVDYTIGLGIDRTAIFNQAEYDSLTSTPGAFGVAVKGQRVATNPDPEPDYAGKPGLNVLVETYYNLEMLDPIYAAILPRGWVRINARVVMQNEGVDTTAGGTAPVGLGSEFPDPGGGGEGIPGSTRIPRISIAEAQPVPAGTTITILLEDHDPSITYDVYFDDHLVGSVTPNAQYFAQIQYLLSVTTQSGAHEIRSEPQGSDTAAASASIEVDLATAPGIAVDGGSRWPAGSPITIRIVRHDAGATYEIFFAGSPIGTITTDGNGGGALAYTIPPGQAQGSVVIESRASGSTVAETSIVITSPSIVVQGGNVWPAGTRIYIFLRGHAPNQTYSVLFGTTQVSGAATTNGIGEAIVSYVIPSNTPDGTYVLKSQQSGVDIAQTNVRVETPPTPFIVIVGGYEWPAGSPITILLRKHSPNENYDVYFGDLSVGRFRVDGNGAFSIAYVIPNTLSEGVYAVRSVRTDNGNQEATVNVTVTEVPIITVDGGLTQAPGAAITIRVQKHAADTPYDIYLQGVNLGDLITGPDQTHGSGEGTLEYTIPPTTPPGDYTLESRAAGGSETIASAVLRVMAPDLRVTDIQIPSDFRLNTPFSVTLTIQNDSEKPITNQFFDVDLYVDPTLEPTPGDSGLPPGIRKYWYDSVPPGGTLTIQDTITLWGVETHQIYARVDTSGSIPEADETNNILGRAVASTICGVEAGDDFSGSQPLTSTWSIENYGDAIGNGTMSLNNGALAVTSKGESTTRSDDNGNRRGLAFAYRTQQAIGDFDIHVQVLSGPASGKAGLEIRKSLNSAAVKLDWVLYQANRLQGTQRASSGGNVSQVGDYISPISAPTWLRIVRQGDEFSLYYATVSTAPPQPGDWLYVASTTMNSMGSTVYVGVLNSSGIQNGASTSRFDNFHLCGDPAGILSCGEVQETGGAVFIDARNYTDNVTRGGKTWASVARTGLYGMQVVDSGAVIDPADRSQVATTSPELQYQVKFSRSGRYYIALLGWGLNATSDSVHMGLGGVLTDQTDDIEGFTTTSGNPPAWLRNSGWYIDIPNAGAYTINLYMREDGAQVYKLALTTQANYPLEGFGPEQSECSATAPPDIPPGYTVCKDVLVNGDFEGDLLTEVMPYWVMAEQELVGRTNVHYSTTGTSFGVIMPSSFAETGTPKQPWMYQEFPMPDWILTNTTAVLDLQKGVDWLGTPNNEPLYFYLRSTSGVTLTNAITVATGQDLPVLNPGSYNNTQWAHLSVDVLPSMRAAGYDPANFAGQALRAYFFSPNPDPPGDNSTEFYLDKIQLDVCTTQPLPSTINNSLGGMTRVNQVLTPGVFVWAYQMQTGGSPGGPVYTTFSLQDSTYHFYNLPPGTYIVFAEYVKENVRYTYQTTAVIPDKPAPNNVVRNLNLVLP